MDLDKYGLKYVPPAHIEFSDSDEEWTIVKDPDGGFYSVDQVDKLLKKTEVGKCKDCKYWGVDFKGVCDKVDNIDTENGPIKMALSLTASDDQGLDGHLVTGPEFGCVHFRSKKS